MGPLIICGTGGSGTRAVADYLIGGGFFMGSELNPSLDSVPFAEVLDGFADSWLTAENGVCAQFPSDAFLRAWTAAQERHLRGHAGGPWGTKNPGTILLMDLLYAVIPEVRFLHVVRDGVEMAYSSNRRQLVLYGDRMLGPAKAGDTREMRALYLWAKVNTRAAASGGQYPGRYAAVRYEDFCEGPGREMRRACTALGLSVDHDRVADRRYSHSPRRITEIQRSAIRDAIADAAPVLAAFGY